LQVGAQAGFSSTAGSAVQAPINVTVQDGGGVVWSPVPGMPAPEHLILFENRGRIAYRRVDGRFARPRSRRELASLDALRADLKAMLIEQGLFDVKPPRWSRRGATRGSKKHARLLRDAAGVRGRDPAADDRPVPAKTVRAFVGRVEVITAILSEVATAFSKDDLSTLNKRGQFLDSIAHVCSKRTRPVSISARAVSAAAHRRLARAGKYCRSRD
jgi:hypothetical protein